MSTTIIFIAVIAVVVFFTILGILHRIKKCPSNSVMVIYGKTSGQSNNTDQKFKFVHGGAAFIWPIIQDYAFLELKPLSFDANLGGALSKQNIRVNVKSRFTIAISSEHETIHNAAVRLLGLKTEDTIKLAEEIVTGQLRSIIAQMDIEELNSNREKFIEAIQINVETELKKIGLKLINANITDIIDSSGYIEALGKQASSQAINDALIYVAKADKEGQTGKAEADKEREVGVALTNQEKTIAISNANKDQAIAIAENDSQKRVSISEKNAAAVKGENEAAAKISESLSTLRIKESEYETNAKTAEEINKAKVSKTTAEAQAQALEARSAVVEREFYNNEIIPAQIAKQKIEVAAEADKAKIIKAAEASAEEIFLAGQAKAKAMYEMLEKKAEGLKLIVEAAGGDANSAAMLLMVEQMPQLLSIQAEAAKNVKIDKVTVWDSGRGETKNTVQSLLTMIPPMENLLNSQGLGLPDFLLKAVKGTPNENISQKSVSEPSDSNAMDIPFDEIPKK